MYHICACCEIMHNAVHPTIPKHLHVVEFFEPLMSETTIKYICFLCKIK